MFILHLVLGALLVVPFVVFGFAHLVTSWKRPNKAAVRLGLALLVASLVLLVSGFVPRLASVRRLRGPRPGVRVDRLLAARRHAAPGDRPLHPAPPGRARGSTGNGPASGSAAWRRSSSLMGLLHAQDPRAFGVQGSTGGTAVLLPLGGRHGQRQVHPGRDADDGRLLPEVPPGRLRRLVPLVAPLQLVQQPGLPVQRARDPQGRAGARRQHAGRPLVRRLPRPGAVLLRRVRRPELRRREQPDRARPGSPAPSATRSPTSTAPGATPTTRSRSRSTTRSPTATTRSCSGSTRRW